MMLSGSIPHLPTHLKERIFLATCLFSSTIIVGTFQVNFASIYFYKKKSIVWFHENGLISLQGTLTGSYSSESYYKDINTLEELDQSGLPIGTSSGSLGSIFDQHFGSKLIESLDSKYHVFTNTTDVTIDRTASKRDICSIERLTDVSVIIAVSLNERVDKVSFSCAIIECFPSHLFKRILFPFPMI